MRNILHPHLSNKEFYCLMALIVIIFVAFLGYEAGRYSQKSDYNQFLNSFRNIREDGDSYTFINPLIGNVSAPATDVGLYSTIKSDVSSYLKTEELKGNLYDYSYYFRDLNTGLWFGENTAESFFPASLFKFPIAIAAYKQIEDDPSLAKRRGVYTQELSNYNTNAILNSESILSIGQDYSVEELVSIMILSSDNGAKNLLLSLLDISYLNRLFEIVASVDSSEIKAYEISSRKYALFLRMLYGSSYLNEEHSELLLKMLSKGEFKNGLVSGVPDHIPVAHKYGVYEVDEEFEGKIRKSQQFHDCGIIYHLRSPYIFCFMTKGKDNDSLMTIISHVSKMIYNNQDKK